MSEEARKIFEAIEKANSIVITSHRSPDGDSMGSSAAVYHLLKNLGKHPTICHPDPSPSFISWVREDLNWFDFESDPEGVKTKMAEADLIFCLDYNGADRLGHGMEDLLRESQAFKIMIDHHPHPEDFVNIAVSRTSECSTCQIVFQLIEEGGKLAHVDTKVAQAIYLGIITDTGSFRFSSVNAQTHEIASFLLTKDINHSLIHERTFDDVRMERLMLHGYAMSSKLEVINHYHIAFIALSEEELKRFNYKKGDTDGLVNIALSISGVKVAVFFAEKDGQIKISFRSKGDISVNDIARIEFNGGGHRNAAGGASQDSLKQTIERFKSLIPKYFKGLNEA
jgi:phosphoesterase RecJ-like protein